MRAEDLKKLGAIYLENVEDGLRNYENIIIRLDAGEAFWQIADRCARIGWEHAFCDFYFYTFADDVRAKIKGQLTEQEAAYLDEKEAVSGRSEGEVLFPLDETLLKIITKLNASEMLFSTVYFVGKEKERSTWWGNYGQEYVIFTEK